MGDQPGKRSHYTVNAARDFDCRGVEEPDKEDPNYYNYQFEKRLTTNQSRDGPGLQFERVEPAVRTTRNCDDVGPPVVQLIPKVIHRPGVSHPLPPIIRNTSQDEKAELQERLKRQAIDDQDLRLKVRPFASRGEDDDELMKFDVFGFGTPTPQLLALTAGSRSKSPPPRFYETRRRIWYTSEEMERTSEPIPETSLSQKHDLTHQYQSIPSSLGNISQKHFFGNPHYPGPNTQPTNLETSVSATHSKRKHHELTSRHSKKKHLKIQDSKGIKLENECQTGPAMIHIKKQHLQVCPAGRNLLDKHFERIPATINSTKKRRTTSPSLLDLDDNPSKHVPMNFNVGFNTTDMSDINFNNNAKSAGFVDTSVCSDAASQNNNQPQDKTSEQLLPKLKTEFIGVDNDQGNLLGAIMSPSFGNNTKTPNNESASEMHQEKKKVLHPNATEHGSADANPVIGDHAFYD